MINSIILRKSMSFGIILLFVGISIIPSTAQKNLEKQIDTAKDSEIPQSMFPNILYQRNYAHPSVPENTSPSFQMKQPCFLWGKNIGNDWENQEFFDRQTDICEKQSWSIGSSYLSEGIKSNYTPHDPIRIEGDDEFTAENGVSSGSGTTIDPYIIEGWEIISPPSSAIDILFTRSHFIIRDCYLETEFGIVTYDIINGTIDNVLFTCNVGLQMEISSNISLNNLTIHAWTGFQAWGIHNLRINNCTFFCSDPGGYGIGFNLQSSSFIELSHLIIHDYYIGIELIFVSHSTITDCEIFDNLAGLSIGSSSYQILKRNHLYNNTYNLDIYELPVEGHIIDVFYHDIDLSNTINGKPIYYLYNQSDLVFDEASDLGFLGLIHCSNITVKNMAITNAAVGVLFVATNDSTITSCTFTNYYTAIGFFYGSQRNVINACQSDGTIYLAWSPNNILQNNTLDEYMFSIQGDTLQDFYQDIDQSNTISGKPMYYFIEKKNQIFKESNVGYLAFINCKNIIISNVDISSNYYGILIVRSRVIIRNSVFSDNGYGLCFVNKSFARVHNSKISSNQVGIEFDRSSAVAVVRCDISENLVGLDFTNSQDIIIRNCKILHNWDGFQIRNSQDNLICNNTISANEATGIRMEGDCRGNEICDNIISYGSAGIQLQQYYPYDMVPGQILLSPQKNNIHHNIICQMESEGIDFDYDADMNIISHNNITENQDGLYLWNCGENNTIIYNNIHGNSYGARAWNCKVNLTHNWWGSADGPSGVGHGTGNPIIPIYNATLTFEPWLTQATNTEYTFFQLLQGIIQTRIRALLT